jgi:NADPH2:quinone reductase
MRKSANDLFKKVMNGDVDIKINQQYLLREAAEAHRALEARETTGSTIFNV